MDKDDKIALGLFGALAVVIGGAIAWVFAGKSEDDGDSGSKLKAKRAEPKPDDGGLVLDAEKAFVPSVKKCDGVPYDAGAYPNKKRVAEDLQKLGYNVTDIESAPGRDVVKSFQRRARELKLKGMAGKSDAWIDGKVGACTLVSLGEAMKRREKGTWSP